ncbi:MAG: SpvB/TcaC N-terminal domain-containing protein, partial [Bacteroidota bacterium]
MLRFLLSALVLVFIARAAQAQQTGDVEVLNKHVIQPEVLRPSNPLQPGVTAKGDLSLSLPVLTVPGRGGLDFQVSLSYSSGIRVNQQAGWVGLGWSFDP